MTSTVSRRTVLLAGVGAGAGAGLAAAGLGPRAVAGGVPADPFTLGIASGDPGPTSVVLWTRLAPQPLDGGGMPDQVVPVQWQVATDERFRHIVRSGTAPARPESAHSVHAEVDGLAPDRWYHYRFRAGDQLSPAGRTRTLPLPWSRPDRVRFAMASCQNYPAGYFTAYRELAAQDLDLVLFLGDYIYEGGAGGTIGRPHAPAAEVMTLADYRTRYAQYKAEPDLQAAHALAPWWVVPDDHEVLDNTWAQGAPREPDPAHYLARRAAAFQAYYEHQPLRRSSLPAGPDMRLYRRFDYGGLARFSLLDTRQYRSKQECGGGFVPLCDAALDESRTMTGPEQERWLLEGLGHSHATWNVVAQQVYLAGLDLNPTSGEAWNMDKWDGYPAARTRFTSYLRNRRPSNPIVLAGDVHASMVNDLPLDFREPDRDPVGTEFVCTSISSGKGNDALFEAARPENPQLTYYNGHQRGFVTCTVDRRQWRTDQWLVDDATVRDSPVRRGAGHVIESGRIGAQPV